MVNLIGPGHSRITQSAGSQLATAIFGYRIPHLPDFLADHTLLAEESQEQLREVLERLVRFVAGLRKWRNSAFSLRFISDPSKGRIDVAVLGRISGHTNTIRDMTAQVIIDLGINLALYGINVELLDVENTGSSGLNYYLYPFSGTNTIVEVRQQGVVVPMMTVQKEAYVVYPFWGPSTPFLEPFEALMRVAAPVAISIHLEPTELTAAESEALFTAAFLADTVADMDRRTFSDASARRLRDPAAELVGRIYTAYRKTLDEPFLLLSQVSGPHPQTTWTIARALATSISTGNERHAAEAAERGLPSQAAIVAPGNDAESAAARRTFTSLYLSPWGVTIASPGKERFPYLVGAEGAAAAFRFPVSVRGGVPGIMVRQRPPDFEIGPRRQEIAADEIHLGNFHSGGAVTVKRNSLLRHGLITGFTGSGKTNTMLYLLDQLWKQHRVPFLVIESAKKEYRGLQNVPGFEKLLVFTLGDETTTPFRLNPFELLDGVRVEAHLGRLQTCFDGALPQFGILPSIVAESLELIYREKGWRLTDRGGESNRPFPTMRDMFRVAVRVSESRGYAGETYQNIRAAVGGRIGGLLRGSKGRMFGAQRSYPLDVLMSQPCVLELNDLNADDKSMTSMFLLMLLREFREQHPGHTLQHVTVVEEAHNVMGNVQSTGPSEVAADTKGQAVQSFADMLTEIRALGEGVLIADQSPSKLMPDAMRNTNLQIAHQLRDAKDREAIGRAMIMDKAQQDYVGKLSIGEAAVFLTGMEKATFMQVPPYKDDAGLHQLPDDAAVRAHMQSFIAKNLTAHLPFDGCRFCGSPCEFVELIEPQTREPELHEQFIGALGKFEEAESDNELAASWRGVARVCYDAAIRGARPHPDAAYCYLAHEIDFPFTEHMRREFIRAYESVTRLG
ncbi:MAG TPA: DUF87 domain-containing protein [Promineifilum sp.]|nr:DUF87 domain-containing protein [Promineifilum sp.]HRO88917.1 DUF87 domain-containing protein [Promineifilum sp.]HRQ12557.1 DUF87 domain-containing protein [Promineifilum sp.]